jgi:hypothetical protein
MSVIKQLANRFQKKQKQQLYFIQTYNSPSPIKVSLNKDDLHDLLQFKCGKRTATTRWEFLANAMRRFEIGQHCYTWVESGRLLGCAWFSYPDDHEVTNDPVTDNIFVLQSTYYHAAAKDRLPSFLQGVIEAAVKQENKTYLLTDDLLFCEALNAAGCRRLE